MRAFSTAIVVWLGVCFASVAEPARLVIPNLPAGGPIIEIDGDLSDGGWTNAVTASLADAATGDAPIRATELSLTWDWEYLYVAFVCHDDGPTNARLTVRDANLWEEEVVEVFIDADDDQKTYIELEWNPLNTLFDAFVINSGKHWLLRDWTMAGIQHAVGAVEDGWVVEIAMPMTEFGEAQQLPPQVGDVWRANFYRIDRSEPVDRPEMTSWSTIGTHNFHDSGAFGYIEFGGVPEGMGNR
ncbi:carbohydrate-binding family 9-like protein [Candidatus Poribacteria bacterium]|jgi:hypothetical protein|nr:carbohydrate-binding family 9-like protein [Candidatus Poribacteria bacterium]MBT5712603.1 carbohydrate-binding family 9-like protein [Candidatus Poribacteria bacterium]MBT7095822.1 carbohydrate-binding family 9-like protein [Candidatus Poribacteria bacterium]MBT7805524.1 carbohydrate-binding family 9-like protein [Candidatus Poribacteria bacterium]